MKWKNITDYEEEWMRIDRERGGGRTVILRFAGRMLLP